MTNNKKQTPASSDSTGKTLGRRDFLKTASVLAGAATLGGHVLANNQMQPAFPIVDSLVTPQEWESLNPGYWQIKNGALRRRLTNIGDRARATGFPFHSATRGQKMATEYDPSLPQGIIYRNDWKPEGQFSIEAEFTYLTQRASVAEEDDPKWKMYQPSFGQFGIAIGSKSLFESYGKVRNAIQIVWADDNSFRLVSPGKNKQLAAAIRQGQANADLTLSPGDTVALSINVTPQSDGKSKLLASLRANGETRELSAVIPSRFLHGYVGVVGRGTIDFEVNEFQVDSKTSESLNAPAFDCYVCYPLGDSLKQVDNTWQCRFVGLFASDGQQVELKIADSPNPARGWANVPSAGQAEIVNHEWRRNTAVINATLPVNPAVATLYYTVWKDGIDVTPDSRIGADTSGPGTGFVGDVPTSGRYVGRLPQLKAPYKLCGLSCHAITSGLQQRTEEGWKILGGSDDWQFRDQPSVESYKHLEDYNFQVMVWEDDVWYMELILYPPSTDDAYRVVTSSIAGPTSRWQMMRHWNVINPGDHDYGMDDVKGPEQIAIRKFEGLGQDASYMRRNFQIVHHLVTGEEDVDPLANPKKWRSWKMPNRDFTFVILDSRLWRSSQDTDMWDDAGWGEFKNLYDRTDPTRSLLGEEQFGWLQNLIHTDSSPLICLTGINGMHTVWGGTKNKAGTGQHIQGPFDQRDRVTADYAGWVKAGSDRVLELLGSRDGVVTVYGDVHNGCIMKNKQHRVIECSFGPIGRSGGRVVIPDFGPQMKDFDGRELEVYSLYHKTHADANLASHKSGDPFYWNFLEMEFDPQPADPAIGLRIRNLIDPPQEKPRGGGFLETTSSQSGRLPLSNLRQMKTLPNADVRLVTVEGNPIRATRSNSAGIVAAIGLPDIEVGTTVVVTAFDGTNSSSQVVTTS